MALWDLQVLGVGRFADTVVGKPGTAHGDAQKSAEKP
jgi:hypothetical protein